MLQIVAASTYSEQNKQSEKKSGQSALLLLLFSASASLFQFLVFFACFICCFVCVCPFRRFRGVVKCGNIFSLGTCRHVSQAHIHRHTAHTASNGRVFSARAGNLKLFVCFARSRSAYPKLCKCILIALPQLRKKKMLNKYRGRAMCRVPCALAYLLYHLSQLCLTRLLLPSRIS